MEREQWLAEIRRRKVERFDTLHAADYDERWGAVPATHADFVARLLAATRPGGRVLDAACGTGRLFPRILEAGRLVEGVDASQGMLEQARRKHPDVPTTLAALPRLAVDRPYDAVMCVDALENLPPEDWAAALAALRAAAADGAPVYLTVEVPDADELARVHQEALDAGLPVVDGEMADIAGGYHYYPSADRTRGWLTAAGLEITDEAEGDDYWHLLCRATQPADTAAAGASATAPPRSPAARPSLAPLATGAVVGAVAAVLLLLAAGSLGTVGVLLTAVVEAAVVYAIYRWSPAP